MANCFAQSAIHGIVFPDSEAKREYNCKQCFAAFQQRPKEVNFSIKRVNNNLYFQTNDKKWFDTLFKNPKDGIAVDVVNKKIYECNLSSVKTPQIKGKLLRPVYSTQLKKGLKLKEEGVYRTLVGRISSELTKEDLEYNILFLGNKNLCQYYVVSNLRAYNWDLLDMGMYLDSISFDNKGMVADGSMMKGLKTRYKKLKFTIPFEKNKSHYVPSDIKPLYDSLHLTDFNIKRILIKAYSSIEGSLERNLQLQKQRSKSIVSALQEYQKPSIDTEITMAENWVDFLNDIQGSEYEALKSMNKSQLKDKLIGSYAQEMESILKNHRKAIITLELEKKDEYVKLPLNDLVQQFNDAIKQDELKEAAKIQNSLFNRLKYHEVSPDILDELEVPEQLKYVRFLNNRSAFKYQLNDRNILIVKNELELLEKLDPTNKRIKYNLVAIDFKIWRFKIASIDENALKKKVLGLKKFGISNNLIQRMMINFYIIKSERYMRAKDYVNKDIAVNKVIAKYQGLLLSDVDYFSLAQFLAYYSNVKQAAKLLVPKVRNVVVDEDLLFYYLNLTLTDNELTKTDDYRAIMLNAINLDQIRYCGLFEPTEKDGVTFQLLEDDYLRKTYCENCNQ